MSTSYIEVAPAAALKPYAACLWQFDGGESNEIQRVVPDGQCELIFHTASSYSERADGGFVRQPRLLFAGQLTRPLHLKTGGGSVVALRFKPASAFAYVGRSLDAFNDKRVSLADIIGASAARKLQSDLDSAPPRKRFDVLQRHAASRIETLDAEPDDLVRRCADRLLAGEPLARVQKGASLNARALQRRFRKYVGVSPQMLTAIARFRRVFEALQAAQGESWTVAAQQAGYFDHPQMNRDFQRFLGCSPSAFIAAGAGLASNLAGL